MLQIHHQIYTFSPSVSYLTKCYLKKKCPSKTLALATSLSQLSGGYFNTKLWYYEQMKRTSCSSTSTSFSLNKGQPMNTDIKPKRKIVEHVTLLRAKEGLTDEEEKHMLDFLYTCQYLMGGIVAVSLGRLAADHNREIYTHAIVIRFQKKENLVKFYENPFYLGVIKDHVMPYCHEILNADYESEVEDDILSIFRKGEEFNYGLEFLLLIAFVENSLADSVEDALASLAELMTEFPSLVVQATQGSNFNVGSKEFTHVVNMRFRSSEAFKMFVGSSEYNNVWRSKFQPVVHKVISISFSVDPVGTEVM